MNFLEVIKTYQTLIGTFLGSFLAIISSILLWSFKNYFEEKKQVENDKKEVEKIFLMASRECSDSINNLKNFVKETKKMIERHSDEISLLIPSRFNKIYINQERLFSLSKRFHHAISQQIDVAVYDAKEFNSWLEMYERFPEIIYKNNVDTIKLGLKTKEGAMKECVADWEKFISSIEKTIKEHVGVIQLRLLRPALAVLYKDKELERMMASGQLDKILENQAKAYLDLNAF
jgi:hypothetical protein